MSGTPDVSDPDESVSELSREPGGKRLSGVKRFGIAAGISLLVIGLLAGTKYAQISALIHAGKAAQAAGPPPQAVATDVATAAV